MHVSLTRKGQTELWRRGLKMKELRLHENIRAISGYIVHRLLTSGSLFKK